MLLQDLNRVNKIDAEIASLHKHLSKLYSERSKLSDTVFDSPANTSAEIVPSTPVETSKALPDQLSDVWGAHGITLPKTKSFKAKLEKAQTELQNLTDYQEPVIVVVPPRKKLEAAVKQSGIASADLLTALSETPKSTAWSVLILCSGGVLGVTASVLPSDLGKYDGHTALGVQEALAATLQGVEIAWPSGWTLLLKDVKDGQQVPCLTRNDNQLVLDTDDGTCLLGENYVMPAIKVA